MNQLNLLKQLLKQLLKKLLKVLQKPRLQKLPQSRLN
jgi:hypothetical protein